MDVDQSKHANMVREARYLNDLHYFVPATLGHSQMETTAIYANAVGEEQQTIAARMWT